MDVPSPLLPRSQARWRWAVHLAVLISYIGLVAGLSFQKMGRESEAALSADLTELLISFSVELVIFAAFFGTACFFSRPTMDDLMARCHKPWSTVFLGFFYALGIRFSLMMVLMILSVVTLILNHGELPAFWQKLQPQVDNLVDKKALLNDPLYLGVNLTLVSFLLAGLREELWRVGMLVGLFHLFPQLKTTFSGQMMVVLFTSILFGLGHFTQGWGGVILASAIGLMLGLILLYHSNLWIAVIAHGFFNATTFVLLYVITKYFGSLLLETRL